MKLTSVETWIQVVFLLGLISGLMGIVVIAFMFPLTTLIVLFVLLFAYPASMILSGKW